LERVEVLHFARNAAVESRSVEACDCGNAALPGQKVLPAFLRADSYGADESNACHNYPASQLCLLLDEVVLGIATDTEMRIVILLSIISLLPSAR